MRVLSHTLPFSILILALAGCGGGSSTPAPAPTDNETGPSEGPVETGSFTLLVTDAETDRFNEIFVTINEAVLIPAGEDTEQQTILDDTLTIDLRALTDFSEFLASAEVDAGTYAKLRLLVEDIELNEVDDNGNLIDTRTANVPSGRIDLTPRGAFSIEGGEDEVVLIDFDADNSFKLVETGNGRIIFRPVVFISVLGQSAEDGETDDPGRFIRLHGQISSPDPENATFELCGLDMMSAGNSDAVRPDTCASVTYGEDVPVFSDELLPGMPEDLVENAPLTVFGRSNRRDDGLVVNALLFALGESSALTSVKGELTSDFADEGFDFSPNPSEPFESSQSVTLLDGALLFDRDEGEVLDIDALQTGTSATIIGAPGDADNEFNVIAVALADDDDDTEVEGTVVDVSDSAFTVAADDSGTEQCVVITDATEIQISGGGQGGREVTEGEPADIAVDAKVEAQGVIDDAGCIVADLVVIDEVESEDD